jgi:AAA domain
LFGLNAADLGVVLAFSYPLQLAALVSVPGKVARTPDKRNVRTAQAALLKASNHQLTEAAAGALPEAVRLLTDRFSFDRGTVEAPDVEQLSEMLATLGRPFGQLVLFGLLLGEAAATPLAVAHRTELEARLRGAARKTVPELLGPQPPVVDPEENAVPETEVADTDGIDGLATGLASLKKISAEVSAALVEIADVVRVGGVASRDRLASFERYSSARDGLVSAFAQFTAVAPANFAEFESELATAREAELAKQRELDDSSRIGELEQQVSELAVVLLNATGTARDHLQAAMDAMELELRQLRPPADVVAEHTPAPVEPKPPVQDDAIEPAAAVPPPAVPEPVAVVVDPLPESETTHVAVVPAARTVEATRRTHDQAEFEDELALGFPWEEGTPPLAVQLVHARRLVEAYWVTAMSGEPDPRSAVLRFAAAAYAVHNHADATSVLATLDVDAQELVGDQDATVLLATAVLRAGLVAGWGHPILAQLVLEQTLSEPWAAFIEAAVAAVRRGVRVDNNIGVVPQADDMDEARAELGRKASVLTDELPRRRNSYQRATRVLQRMLLNDQPVKNALDAVVAWSAGKADSAALDEALAVFEAPNAVDVLIEDADAAMRTPKQAKEPIVAVSLRSLQRAVEEVQAIVREAAVVDRRLSAADSDSNALAHRLARATADVESVQPPYGMTGAALALLRAWLTNPDQCVCFGMVREEAASDEFIARPAEPSSEVLLALPDLPRDAAGRPDPDDPRTVAVLSTLGQPLDLSAAVARYCERGDLRRANRVVVLSAEDVWPVDIAPVQLGDTVAAAEREWTARYRMRLTEVRDLFARIRTQNLLDQVEESTVAGRLEGLGMVADGAFDVGTAGLADLAEELVGKQRSRIDAIRDELAGLEVEPNSQARIVALLKDEDTVTATEFLSFVRAGKPLPEHAEQPTQAASSFLDLISSGQPERRGSARAWAEAAASDRELTAQAVAGVDTWDLLEDPKRHSGDRLANAVRDILRTLGLNCAGKPKEGNSQIRQGLRRFRVGATPTDGSYVAVLGSAAVDYTVVVVFDERRGGRSVLDVLGPGDSGRANIVLYVHPMDLAARRSLAVQANGTSAQAIVVDPVVMGWVAATAPGSWRATQRVTLPWTALNPYAPFVAGLVPPEVFVGRTREMSEVSSPQGGLFIYGGRQLGKSALLRRVEATFQDGNQKHAVYIDLKGRGIGEAEPAKRIWRELAIELKNRGVLTTKVSDDPPADVVVNQVRNWLNSQHGRHLLLLADEADAFLTADSRGEPSPGGVSHFPNLLRLKELMESTERRFKVVFAGLHQVQRFGHLSNVPLVHGGPPILIGPLEPRDARDLVVQPMAALGYTFERPELVWRLLSATNYQASLIQIFCEELVRNLHSRAAGAQGLPVPIRESDVDAVSASDSVRAHIAERLRITINLEDRYRVLTLVIALRSLEDAFTADYGPDELLELAKQRWPAGFDDLTVAQLRIYLDEMEGLGLLIRLSGQSRYAVRSPNVVNMLGTKADLERELDETDFDLPYEYNPLAARRLLVSQPGLELRSPLTDGQLAELTRGGEVSVITGSSALGIDRVPDAVRDYVEMRGNKVEVLASTAEVTRVIGNATRRSKQTVIVVDGRTWRESDLVQVGERLKKVAMAGAVAAMTLTDVGVADTVARTLEVDVVRPTRWTAGTLRSWPECPFDVPDARQQLIVATGGWPALVEETIARVVTRNTRAQALHHIRLRLEDPARAASFLAEAGVTAEIGERIRGWVEYFDPGEIVSPVDAMEALGLGSDIKATNAVLAEMADMGLLDESSDGVALDRVVHRCLSLVGSA